MSDAVEPEIDERLDERLAAVDGELAELQAESRRRQRELKEMAAELAATRSRRVIVRQLVANVGDAPDKEAVTRRVVSKIVRTPFELLRRGR